MRRPSSSGSRQPQPTFLENLSSFSVPIVIVPKENTDAPPLQLKPVGTGPLEFVEFVADSHVKLKRFDGYKPERATRTSTGSAATRSPASTR